MSPSRSRAVAHASFAIIFLFASCTLSNAQPSTSVGEGRAAKTLPVSPLVIESQDRRITFRVELAQTPEQRRAGLMFRLDLPADQGMLFDFAKPVPVAMWMKNTYIPLDMIFIGEEGLIVKIAKDTEPHSLETISSGQPVRAVLEINGGLSDRLGLGEGDRIVHRVFGMPQYQHLAPTRP